MQTLREISQWIRDYGHDPRHMQRLLSVRFNWHQLWTAMDIIDDVDLALSAYLRADFPVDDGEKYLRIYGVLQALFVQQDALRHLIGVIRPSTPLSLPDALKEVREIRNACIGHPTKLERNGQVSVHGMSRITISRDGFQMLSFIENTDVSFQYIPVRELIEKQRSEAVQILSEVARQLKENDEIHKKQFRDTKLGQSFNQVLYAFEKIFEDIRRRSVVGMGQWGVGHLQTCLDEFERLLNLRGIAIEAYDSIKFYYGEIHYPLAELKKYFDNKASDIRMHEEARVFADAMRGYFSKLMDIAQEIDEEYSSTPGKVSNSEGSTVRLILHEKGKSKTKRGAPRPRKKTRSG